MWKPISRILQRHTIAVLACTFLIGIGLCAAYTWSSQRKDVSKNALESATVVATVISEFRVMYAAEVVARAKAHGMQVRYDYQAHADAIPLPATLSMMLAERVGSQRGGVKTKLYSPYPFPHRAERGGLRDDFAKQAWQALNRNPDEPFVREGVVDGQRVLRFARADLMGAACVGCHNSHPESPKRGWEVGQVRGILEVNSPIERAEASARITALRMFGILGVIVVLGIFTMTVVTSRLRRIAGELEEQVQDRTRELRVRGEDMRTVLDNVLEGVFTIDRDTVMSDERSAMVERWFGPAASGMRLFDYLRAASGSFAERSELAWTQVIDDFLPTELALDQMPKQLVDDRGSCYELSYAPIGAAPPQRFLVTIRDVSEQVARARAEEEQREVMEIVGRVLSARKTFLAFFDETSELVRQIGSSEVANAELFKRQVHTLKGNTAIFGLPRIAELCHELETALAAGELAEAKQFVERIKARWSVLRGRVDALLGRREHVIEVEAADQRAIEQALRKQIPREDVLKMVHRLRLEAVQPRLAHLGDQATALAVRLDKQLRVKIDDGGVRVDSEEFAPLWQAMVHLVRNAVDHGIESPEQRASCGKDPTGTLCLKAQIHEGKFAVELSDDGAGIDWEAVRAKAEKLGLPCSTEEELLHALLADGLSTAREITGISGRGVGFGAAVAAIRGLGGVIDVSATRHAGTTIHIEFDEAKTAPELASLLRLSMPPRSLHEQLGA